MPREQLLGLAADTDRLLAAGAAAVPGHDGLRRRAKALRDLSAQVAAIVPVADAAERAVNSTSQTAVAALLDLTAMGRQLRASLAAVGPSGDLVPPPASGPWRTPLTGRDLELLVEALTQAGTGREEALRKGRRDGSVTDLRLVAPLLDALNDGNTGLANLVAQEMLPAQGPGVLPELRAALDLNGKVVDGRRLMAVCHFDKLAGADLCRRALAEGSPTLRIWALECLATVGGPGEAEEVALKYCRDKKSDLRCAALKALGQSRHDDALEALVEALCSDDAATIRTAQEILEQLPHPGTSARLLRELPIRLAAWDQADAAIAVAKKAAKKAAPATKTQGKTAGTARTDPVAKAEAAAREAEEVVTRLLNELDVRTDHDPAVLATALLPLREHKSSEIASAAVAVLGRAVAGSAEVLPALVALLDDKSKLAMAAFQALGNIPPEQRRLALPRLLQLADKAKSALRPSALSLLGGHLATEGDRVRPVLRAVLKANDSPGREAVAAGLAKLGPAARELLPDLLDIVGHQPPYRSDLDDAFTAIDPDGGTVIPKLIELLDSKKENVRWMAAHCLGNYGGKAHAAVPKLGELTGDNFNTRSYVFQEAIRRILRASDAAETE